MKRFLAPLAVALGATAVPSLADTLDIGAAKDNTLYEDPAGILSNGLGEHMFAGRTAIGAIRRAVIEFDIAAALPAGSTINAVTLTLNMSRTMAGPENVSLHPVLAEWGEGTSDAPLEEGGGDSSTTNDATWIHTYYSSSFWASVGGDFGAASATTVVDFESVYSWTSATMASDVQGWLDFPASNHGWMLIGNEAGFATSKRFDTKDNIGLPNRPVLSIDYTPPPVGTALCFGVGCPCGNDDPTAGCKNATGVGGLLSGSGTASVGADDLVLNGTQIPPFNQGLFYMGDTVVNNPFFDGKQCALGTTLRFLNDIQNSGASGTMTLGPGIVAKAGGLIVSGTTWYFHAWHRDTVGPCGSGANLTNLYGVTFVP